MGREKKLSRGLDIALVAEAGRSGIGTGNQTQHTENGNHRGGSVADQRQGQTDNGHNADAHTGVDHHLEHQSGGRTVADQTAHIVGAAGAHPDASADNSQLHNHDQHASEEAQLLANGGEDIVRMLGEEVAALGTVAVEQTLTEEAAAGEGLKVDLTVVTGAGTLGVEGGIDQDQDTLLLILAQEVPDEGDGQSNAADSQGEPPEADAAGKGHTDEDKYENQGNACVTGQCHVQADQQAQVKHHVANGCDAGNPVLVGGHNRGHDNNVGNFTDLRRLNIKGNQGNIQPASVTGVVIGAEGNQQQKQENIENHQAHPELGQHLQVDGGDHGEDHNAQTDGDQLQNDVADIAFEFLGGGGAGDADTAEAGNN